MCIRKFVFTGGKLKNLSMMLNFIVFPVYSNENRRYDSGNIFHFLIISTENGKWVTTRFSRDSHLDRRKHSFLLPIKCSKTENRRLEKHSAKFWFEKKFSAHLSQFPKLQKSTKGKGEIFPRNLMEKGQDKLLYFIKQRK